MLWVCRLLLLLLLSLLLRLANGNVSRDTPFEIEYLTFENCFRKIKKNNNIQQNVYARVQWRYDYKQTSSNR